MRKDRNDFLIYAFARTGSYHLVSLLDSAPDVICHGEIFKDKRVELRPWHKQRALTDKPEERDKRPWQFVRHLRSLNPNKHFGFKVLASDLGRVWWLNDLLHSGTWFHIALVRDPLEVYASLQRARATRLWVRRDVDRDVAIRFDPDSFERFLTYYSSYLSRVFAWRATGACLVINYRNLNQIETRARLLSFIGSKSDPEQLTSKYEKQSERSVGDAFENLWDLSSYLLEHPLPEIPENLEAPVTPR